MIDRDLLVYITDEVGAAHGTGLLYHEEGQSRFFVLTCRHVVESLAADSDIRLLLMAPIRPETDDYAMQEVIVPSNQVIFSSKEADIAVIHASDTIGLKGTGYRFGRAFSLEALSMRGYPFSWDGGGSLVALQDEASLTVVANPPGAGRFDVRLEGAQHSGGDLRAQLEGLSDSPLFREGADGNIVVYGFMSALRDPSGKLGRALASEAVQAAQLLRDLFGVDVAFSLDYAEEETRQPSGVRPARFSGIDGFVTPGEADAWLQGMVSESVAYANGLKIGLAIEAAETAIADDRFGICSAGLRLKAMQVCAFGYRISKQHDRATEVLGEIEEAFPDEIESKLGRAYNELESGNLEAGHYWAREATLLDQGNVMARFYCCLCEILASDPIDLEPLAAFIDGKENLVCDVEGDDAALMYQEIGFAYSRAGQHGKALRCLTRAYGFDGNLVVCETLGCEYHDYAMRDAVDADGKVLDELIDRKSLTKSRDCLLKVLEAADDVYRTGFMRRAGGVAFNVFFFLQDRYRISAIYPELLSNPPDGVPFDMQDIQMKMALTRAPGGGLDISAYDLLDAGQIAQVTMIADFYRTVGELDFLSPEVLKGSDLEGRLRACIGRIEGARENLPDRCQPQAVSFLANLYAKGVALFGWDGAEKVGELATEYASLQGSSAVGAKALEALALECVDPAAAGDRFKELFERDPSLENWNELVNYHTRRGEIDEVERCYAMLFEMHGDLVAQEPEMLVRQLIDFVIARNRNLKIAIEAICRYRDSFSDMDVLAFWELDIASRSMAFNDPDGVADKARALSSKGLISKEEARSYSFDAYLANLDFEKAEAFLPQRPVNLVFEADVRHFLACAGRLPALRPFNVCGMRPENASAITLGFSEDGRPKAPVEVADSVGFGIVREVVVDAWGMYELVSLGHAGLVEALDRCFVTHSSVVRLMHELSIGRQASVVETLRFISECDVVEIVSPTLDGQLPIRSRMPYYEPMSAIALAEERKCLAVLGVGDLDAILRENAVSFVRPLDLEAFIS